MILKVENLSISFDKQVVENISFEVPEGQVVAIVGKSGSGKTVTGRAIMGLLSFDGGKIENGKILFKKEENLIDLAILTQEEYLSVCRNDIAMIFQDPMASLNPIMKIEKQLAEVVKLKCPNIGKTQLRQKLEDTLQSVGLDDTKRILKSYPFMLSGGMCQRVMICMALLKEPSFIIADEPTTFLDSTTEAQIIQLLEQIHTKQNKSILFITHNLELVKSFAQSVVVMSGGRVVETGKTEQIFACPSHPYTKKLLESIY